MKTRSASKRKPLENSPNSSARPTRSRVKSKQSKKNQTSEKKNGTSDSSGESSDENISFQRRSKNVKRRLRSDSEASSDSSEKIGHYRRKTKKFKRQRLSSNSSASSQQRQDSETENQNESRQNYSSEESSDASEPESSPSTSNGRRVPKRKTKRKRLSRDTSSSSAETNNNESYSSAESDQSDRRTKKSKRIRFLKNTEHSSEDSEQLDVSGLLKYKLKKLRFAVSYNNTQQVSDIITDKYVKLDSREFGNLLWRALENKNIKIISMLVRAGVDVNTRGSGDDRDKTLLHVVASKSASEQYEQLALLLIEHEADIEELDANGNTVLHWAVQGGSSVLVEKLLELGVDINAVNYQEESILYTTSKSPHAKKFLPLLVQHNVPDLRTRNDRAMEVLGYLIRGTCDLAVVKLLLDLDVPVNEKDARGLTLLDYAISRQKSYEIVKLLLDYGADPTQKRSDGVYPLWWASTYKTSTIAALLIKYGANIHSRNDNGQYALHAACSHSSVQCISLLLFLGANINEVDERNLTPFSIMNTTYLNDANKLVVKHIAILVSKKVRLKERNLLPIYSYPFMHQYFERCYNELHNLKTLKIYNNISAYCILAKNVQTLTQFIRNKDFVKNYYAIQKKIVEAFPIYSSSIQKLFSRALRIRKAMNCEMDALNEGTNFILPEEIWEMITFYSCCNRMVNFFV